MTARRINLLPQEHKQRRKARQSIVAAGAGVIALVVLLGLVYASQEVRLRSERNALAQQEIRIADLRAQVAELREFEELERELEEKSRLLADLSDQEVRWSVLLADISLVIPSDVWLTSFTGNVAATGEETDTGFTAGQIQMSGTTFEHPDVARWLTRLDSVDAFVFPYLSLSAQAEIDSVDVVNFTTSVQLSPDALRRNQRGAVRSL